MQQITLEAQAGITIYASTGKLGLGQADRMSTMFFYKAGKGSRVSLLNSNYYFNIATYSLEFDERYIYSYCYQDEESWTTYNHDLSGDTYRQEDYIFSEEVYFRICMKRVDGKAFTDEEAASINNILLFESVVLGYSEKEYFIEEIQNTAATILEKRAEKLLVLGVLTDSHYTVNGTWEDTKHNIKAVNQRVHFDGIIHLGDISDGMLSAKVTQRYAETVINDLKENQVPVFVVLGNHDSNYFNCNLEPMTENDQYEIYLKHSAGYINNTDKNLYYYVDFNSISLRCIFLSSFDYREKIRYGFSYEELSWVDETLKETPDNYSIVFFSHEAPLAVLDYWSDVIRNGDELVAILEVRVREGKKIMAYIHGHTHADYVYRERLFPIISIGCSKCEYFTDKKPDGSMTAERKQNAVSQELWDTVIISPEANTIDFVRFGAGEDRTVIC